MQSYNLLKGLEARGVSLLNLQDPDPLRLSSLVDDIDSHSMLLDGLAQTGLPVDWIAGAVISLGIVRDKARQLIINDDNNRASR